jgi:hypothetical protein
LELTRHACLARLSTTADLTCFGTTLTANLAILFATLVALAKSDEVIELLFKVEVVDLRMRDEE